MIAAPRGVRSLRARAGILAACFALACAGPARAPRSGAGSERLDTAVAALSRRAEYSTDRIPDPIRGGPLADELAARVRAHFPKILLEGDGRMADIATRVAAETQRVGRPPGPAGLDAIARDTGFVGPPPTVFVVPRAGADWDRVDEFLSMSPANIRYSRYGVVVLDVGGAVVGAVALGVEQVVIEPIPRRVHPSERVRIRATLAPGYEKAEVAWTRPDGSTRRIPAGTRAVSFETPPLEQGIHRIEILAVGPSGLEVLANMPIASGVEPEAPAGPPEAVDESDPKAALFTLVNRERSRAGLRTLQADSSLDDVALGHSQDMVDAHFFGHQSPTTGVVEDRLRAHGMRLGLFGENVAKGPSMVDAHAMLLASPAHRANVMNPRFSHVGIGVVAERSSDPPLYSVTEVFAGFPAPITDFNGANAALFTALNGVRAAAKAPALARAPALDAIAREIGARVGESPTVSPVEIAEPIIRRGLAGTRYRRPLLLVGFTIDPTELANDSRLKGTHLRAAGVAVVQSPSSSAPRTNVVVFVLSE